MMASNDSRKRRAEQTRRERINSNKVLLSERVEVDFATDMSNIGDLGGHLYTGADQVLCITDRGGDRGEVCAVEGRWLSQVGLFSPGTDPRWMYL